jgi:threonine 3-dehydrogenase
MGATSCIASSSATTTRATTSSSPRTRRAGAWISARCDSPVTVPSGGTSDYAPEMIHAAAKGEPYACFVRPDTRIPFMAMPDGVEALLTLAQAPRAALTRTAYNLAAFAPTAEEVRAEVLRAFPDAAVTYKIDEKRQGIVDSWPEDVDDSAARRDWGFAPRYDFGSAFRDYLIPAIKGRYAKTDG